MHQLGFVDPEDLNITSGKRKYSSAAGYSGSKLAEIMFSSVLQRKLPSEAGVNVMCVSPGVVMTNVARDLPSIIQTGYHPIPYFLFSAQEGECRPANASAEAHNMDTALKIWDKTLELIGVPADIVEKLIECEQVPSENGHSNVTEVDCW